MADIGSSYPIALQVKETKEMQLKWIAARKQECRSKISHGKQAIEDLVKGKVPDIERQILHAEQELAQLEAHEKMLISAIDTEEIK